MDLGHYGMSNHDTDLIAEGNMIIRQEILTDNVTNYTRIILGSHNLIGHRFCCNTVCISSSSGYKLHRWCKTKFPTTNKLPGTSESWGDSRGWRQEIRNHSAGHSSDSADWWNRCYSKWCRAQTTHSEHKLNSDFFLLLCLWFCIWPWTTTLQHQNLTCTTGYFVSVLLESMKRIIYYIR